MIIDVHTHYLPGSCIHTGSPRTRGAAYSVRYEEPGTGELLWEAEGVAAGFDLEQLHSLTRRREDMDHQGVRVQVLSVPPPFGFTYSLDPAKSETICRLLNDGLSAAAKSDPARFLALATLPLQSVRRSLPELDRITTDLGMNGVAIGTHVGKMNLDHRDLFPFFERLEHLGLPLFIHSTVALGGDRVSRYHLKNLIGNPTEDALAAASLIFGGVLEAFPALRVYIAHGGGSSPYILGRWDRGYEVRSEAVGTPHPPSYYFRRLWFDSLTHSPEALEHLVRVAGTQHVMVGTDYPYDMSQPDPASSLILASRLSDSDREMVGVTNAAKLFDLPPVGESTEVTGHGA